MKSNRNVKEENGVRYYQCTSCGKFLTKDCYSKNNQGFDGIQSKCKKCMSKKTAEYKKLHKDKRNAYQREYSRRRGIMFESGLQELPEIIENPIQPEIDKVTNDEIAVNEEHIDNIDPTEYTPDTALKFYDGDNTDYHKLFPEAFDEAMNDEDVKNAFLNRRNKESRTKYLEMQQKKFTFKKADNGRAEINKKFRHLAEDAFKNEDTNKPDENKLKFIEKSMDIFSEDEKRKYMEKMISYSKETFASSWKSVLKYMIDIKNGIINN